MAFLGETFSTDELPQSESNYEPIPIGWYNASITEADLQPNSKGTGEYIKVRFDITGPSHEGRCVFSYLNIKNQNQKAEEIGRQQLGDIMRAIGETKITDTDQLIGGTLQIKVAVRKGKDNYEDSNEVKNYKAIDGSKPAASSQPSQESGGGSTPPWAKK